jgi:MFS family permease
LSESSGDLTVPKYDPLAALRQTSFLLYTASRMFSITGQTLLQAVMAWQVYDTSGSALNLGILGLVRFFPSLGMSLIGGAAADTYNRRNIIVIAQSVPLTCAAILAAATFGGWIRLELIFALVLLMGFASAFEGPARSALLPAIVRPDTFANAVTVGSTLQTMGMVSGPALAGAVIATLGVGAAYTVYVGLTLAAIVPLLLLRYRQVDVGMSVSLDAIKEGVRFVRQRPVLLGAMSLDMFAVVFGGAAALLPVYAKDILHVGSEGYGLLTASLEVGAFLMSLVLVFRPPIQKAGRTLIWVVALYGAFTIGFGLSREFILSLVLYGLIGAADQVSVVMRNTIIQLATPDELRGRVSAVASVFIGASNQVGAMESGFVAAVTSATFAVVSGGVAAIGVAGLVGWRIKELYNYETPRGLHLELRPAPEPAASPAAGGGG